MLRNYFLDRHSYNEFFRKKVDNNLGKIESVNLKSNKVSKKLVSYTKDLQKNYFNKKTYLSKFLIAKRIYVHNGKEIVSLKVMPNMVGYKIGEFFYLKRSRKK